MIQSQENSKRSKKGQTSVEYLIILAIAIIIAVVAVGVLSGFIKIGSATSYKKKAAVYWKGGDIAIVDWEIYETSVGQNSTLILSNNKEYQIRIDWISTDWDGITGTTFAIGVNLIPGETYLYATNSGDFNCSSSQTYSYPITFQYDNVEYEVNNKHFTGVEKLTGSCSN